MENRQNNFNIIRFVAAIMVMAGHMGSLTGTPPLGSLGLSINAEGIAIFFLIGGYLITKSWLSDPHPLRYAVKRASRILPPLIGYVLLAALVLGPLLSTLPLREYFASPQLGEYLKNIAFYIVFSLPGVFTGNPYPNVANGSLWSLPVEVLMYLLVPLVLSLLALLTRDEKKRSVLLAAVVLEVCALRFAQLLFFPAWRQVIYHTDLGQVVMIMPYYFLGMLYTLPAVKKLLNLQVATVLMLGSLCLAFGPVKMELVRMILLPYIIFSLAFCPQPRFAHAFARYDISYGIYLYGFFVQQAVVQLLGVQRFSFMALLSLSVLVTIGFAYFSAAAIEAPAEKIRKKLLAHLPVRG